MRTDGDMHRMCCCLALAMRKGNTLGLFWWAWNQKERIWANITDGDEEKAVQLRKGIVNVRS